MSKGSLQMQNIVH